MDVPRQYPAPGSEVKVTAATPKGKQWTNTGIIYANRYPHLYLSISIGGHVLDIPWDRVIETSPRTGG